MRSFRPMRGPTPSSPARSTPCADGQMDVDIRSFGRVGWPDRAESILSAARRADRRGSRPRNVDAAYVCLHGAMAGGEGRGPGGPAARAILGRMPDKPLVASLDLHAVLTDGCSPRRMCSFPSTLTRTSINTRPANGDSQLAASCCRAESPADDGPRVIADARPRRRADHGHGPLRRSDPHVPTGRAVAGRIGRGGDHRQCLHRRAGVAIECDRDYRRRSPRAPRARRNVLLASCGGTANCSRPASRRSTKRSVWLRKPRA